MNTKTNQNRTWLISLFLLLVVTSTSADTIYVKSGAAGDGSTWANAYGLLQDALNDADPDDEMAGTYKQEVWSFTTANHFLVDDMETYSVEFGPLDMIWDVWVDGMGNCYGSGNGTGANVEVDQEICRGGVKSMKFDFDNDGDVWNPCTLETGPRDHLYSKIEAQIWKLPSGIGTNWAALGAGTLSIPFYGMIENDINEDMWVELTDNTGGVGTLIYGEHASENPFDVAEASWHEWKVCLSDFVEDGVNLSNLKSLAIGFGTPGATAPGGSGTVYFDEIYLLPGPVIYVDDDAAPNGNGLSWETAYRYLQDALNTSPAYGNEIWVAAGTYKPDQGGDQTPGDREATFQLIRGVALYGGFPAGGGTWEQRDPNLHQTILSGDLAGNDEPVADPADLVDDPNRSENCYHVFYHPAAANLDPNAVLDGFMITGGNANSGTYPDLRGLGGGMYNNLANPMLVNCTFSGNSASRDGGGMYNNASSNPTIIHCTISGNSADFGGGMFNNSSSPIVSNCIFSNNRTSGSGGGMRNCYSSPTVTGCIFSGNRANGSGGGMDNYDSDPNLTNCTFTGNLGSFAGAAISNNVSAAGLTNCILWDNNAPQDAQIHLFNGSTLSIGFSDIQGGLSGIYSAGGGGTVTWRPGNIDADPRFKNADGPDNILGTEDDNLQLAYNSPCIDAGDNKAVPLDTADRDSDGDTTERIPLDLAGHARFTDDPLTADTGATDLPDYPNVVDMGACERYEFCGGDDLGQALKGDLNLDCTIDLIDFEIFCRNWLQYIGPE